MATSQTQESTMKATLKASRREMLHFVCRDWCGSELTSKLYVTHFVHRDWCGSALTMPVCNSFSHPEIVAPQTGIPHPITRSLGHCIKSARPKLASHLYLEIGTNGKAFIPLLDQQLCSYLYWVSSSAQNDMQVSVPHTSWQLRSCPCQYLFGMCALPKLSHGFNNVL